jgi:26S proteasome regulatory subunit T6
MGKNKVLVKTQPEGKYIVDLATDIKLEDLRPNLRVALRSDCGLHVLWHRMLG